MDMCHPDHEEKTKKCFWDLHGFNESESHCFEHDKDENDHHDHHEGCVGEVLKAILHAQEKAKKQHDCHHSCKESISDLLEEKKRTQKNTIPFLLFCGDCEPFKASGVKVVKNHYTKEKKFACISSFIFKIKDLNDGCAVLELLTFKPDKSCNSDHKENQKSPCTPFCQIDFKDVDDLIGTGICITVDLSCFCAISCLPAVFIK